MQLNHWRQVLARPRALTDWQPLCREMLQAFFAADVNTDAALMLIEEQWQQVMTGFAGALRRRGAGGVVAR